MPFLKTFFNNLVERIIFEADFLLLKSYNNKEILKLVKEITKEKSPFSLKPKALIVLHSLANHQKNLKGDFAEVGVFKGVSSQMICEAKGDKPLYLFDTFEGYHESKPVLLEKKMLLSNPDDLRKKLKNYPNVYIYKGLFPETADPIKDKSFAFVHLDVDFYQSMKNCLDYFYSRTVKNGILLLHDYQSKSVRKAIHEFFQDKPEPIIQLPLTQCMIIKQ